MLVKRIHDVLDDVLDELTSFVRVGKIDLGDQGSECVQDVLIALLVAPRCNEVKLHDLHGELLGTLSQYHAVVLAKRIEAECRCSEGEFGVCETSNCVVNKSNDCVFDFFIDECLPGLVDTELA